MPQHNSTRYFQKSITEREKKTEFESPQEVSIRQMSHSNKAPNNKIYILIILFLNVGIFKETPCIND